MCMNVCMCMCVWCVQAAWRCETRVFNGRSDLLSLLFGWMMQGRVRAHFSFFVLLVAFSMLLLLLSSFFAGASKLWNGRPPARPHFAGWLHIGFTFIHSSAGPGLYYLAGTYYQDLDKRAACNSRPVDCLELD
jgi:hypothetical protein